MKNVPKKKDNKLNQRGTKNCYIQRKEGEQGRNERGTQDEGKEKRYVSWLFQNVLILITQPRLRVLDP